MQRSEGIVKSPQNSPIIGRKKWEITVQWFFIHNVIPILTIITSALGLGLDSFFVSIPLGMLADRPLSKRRMAVTFGTCDGIATLVGAALGSLVFPVSAAWFHEIGPVLVALYGMYVLATSVGGLWHMPNNRALYFLAMMLSLDNFIAGSAVGGLSVSSAALAAMAGFISGVMAFAGCSLGAVLAKGFPAWRLRLAGPLLILFAFILLLW